jgi:hypothetical protein
VKGICLFLSGVSVGWLIGLSVSPIIHVIIASLIALVVSITAALAGVNIPKEDSAGEGEKSKPKTRVEVNPVPLMFMVVGIVAGSSLGVYARTNGWLGPNPSSFVEKWKDTELTKKEISRRLFDELYPPNVDLNSATPGGSPSPGAQSSAGRPANQNSNNSSTDTSGHTVGDNASPSEKESGRSGGKSPDSSDSVLTKSMVSALFSNLDADDCAQFRIARDEKLKDEMESGVGSNEQARQVIRQCPDIKCLRKLVEKICPR